MGRYLTLARRHSLCDDDAQEAVARSFEIALRHRDRISADPGGAEGWMAVVVKHEAMRVRRHRFRYRSFELDPRLDHAEEPDDREQDPRLPALREAMRTLKPDEARALILLHSLPATHEGGGRYRVISNQTGWSHWRVNGLIRDGYRKLRVELGAVA